MCLCVQCVQCPTCNALVGGWPTVELLFSYVCNVSAGMVTCSVCGCVQVRARAVCVSQTAEHWWGVGALQSSSLATYMCNVRTGMVTCVHARAGVKYVCLCASEQCVELRLQSIGGFRLARCRAPLPRAVSQLGTSWYQPSPCNPSTPLQGELTATTCAGPFQELVLASSGGTEEASNPSVLGEEGSDFEAHGELNLPL